MIELAITLYPLIIISFIFLGLEGYSITQVPSIN
jgi:hypothetical protein